MTRSFFVLLSVCLSVAGVARAKISDIHSPYAAAPCVGPTQAAADMSDPNGYYAAGGAQCPSLCKKAEADCKQYVRVSFGCWNSFWADALSYEKRGCAIGHPNDPPAKNQCKSQADAILKTYRQDAQNARDLGLSACEDWEATCEATCGP
ncbi:MAG TPA: hypothetical protein VMR86_16325 [Myxococcota bacterium]|nr:hypothetical protein [Myxococcota bacterium]